MANITASMVKELREKTGAGIMDARNALVEVEGDMDKAVDYLREQGLASAAKKANRIAAEGVVSIKVDGNSAAIIEVNAETDFVAKNDQFQTLVAEINDAVLVNKPADLEAALALEIDGETIDAKITEATRVIGERISFRRFEVIEKTDADVFGQYLHAGGSIGAVVVIEGSDNEETANGVAMHITAMAPQYVSREDVPADVYAAEEAVQKEIAANEGKGRPEHILEKMVTGRMNQFLGRLSLTEQPFVRDEDMNVAKFVEQNGGGTIKEFVRYQVGEGMERREEDFATEVAEQMGQ